MTQATATATQLSPHLKDLENESIHIIREVAAEFERPALLFSGGKDSIVMLHLAQKAFWPARIPFPLVHVDTGHNFPEVLEFRDRRAAELADEGHEVAGDVRTAVALPAEVGVAAAPEVEARHPVAGGDEARDDEAVGVPAVADAVGEYDEGALAGDVVREPAGADGELCGHVVLLD